MFGLFEKTFAPAIRPLHAGHGAACAAIHAASFAFPWDQDEIEAMLAASSSVADGAFGSKTNDLQGFVITRCAADEAEVLTIAVVPRKRGQGIARRLLGAHLPALAAQGVKSLFLEAEATNAPALAVYRRFGFETAGERKSYYRKPDGSTALAYILRKTIA